MVKMKLAQPDCQGVCAGIATEGMNAFFSYGIEKYREILLQIEEKQEEELLNDPEVRKFLKRIARFQDPANEVCPSGLPINQADHPELTEDTNNANHSSANNDNVILRVDSCQDYINYYEAINHSKAMPLATFMIENACEISKQTQSKVVIYISGHGIKGHAIWICIDSGKEEFWDSNELLKSSEINYKSRLFKSLYENIGNSINLYCIINVYIQTSNLRLQEISPIYRHLRDKAQRYQNNSYMRKHDPEEKQPKLLLDFVISMLQEERNINFIEGVLSHLMTAWKIDARPFSSSIGTIIQCADDIVYVLNRIPQHTWQHCLPFFFINRKFSLDNSLPREYLDITVLITKLPKEEWKNIFDALNKESTYRFNTRQQNSLQRFYKKLSHEDQAQLALAMGPSFAMHGLKKIKEKQNPEHGMIAPEHVMENSEEDKPLCGCCFPFWKSKKQTKSITHQLQEPLLTNSDKRAAMS